MVEAERFELSDPCGPAVFKTAAINQTRPHFHIWYPVRESNSRQEIWSFLCYHYTNEILFGTTNHRKTYFALVFTSDYPTRVILTVSTTLPSVFRVHLLYSRFRGFEICLSMVPKVGFEPT